MTLRELGQSVHSQRARLRLGVRDVAIILDTSPSSISRLERGRETLGSLVLSAQRWLEHEDDRLLTLPCAP